MENNFETRLAKTCSYLFHPLLMPLYSLQMLLIIHSQLNLFLPLKTKIILLAITFIFTALLPALNIFLLVKTKFISNVFLEQRKERTLAYIAAILFYLSEYYLLKEVELFSIPRLLILGATISLVLAFCINFFWQISTHAIGVGGLIGATLALLSKINATAIIPLLILIAGLVSFSRLKLNAHTPAQVYCGFLLGLLSEWLVFLYP